MRFGLLDRTDFVLVMIVSPFIIISLGLATFSELQSLQNSKEYSFDFFNFFTIFLKPLILLFLFLSIYYVISFILEKIRKKIPYEKEKIIENGKKYEIHHYPIFNLKKYYHKGKLHREKDAAYIIEEHSIIQERRFFLNGNEINKNDFNQELLKNKINTF